MPFGNGNEYTKADIRKKLMGAVTRFSKNQLQAGVYLLIDALGMIQQVAGRSDPTMFGKLASEERPVHLAGLPDRVGAAEGGFRKAVINELIGEAIGDIQSEHWLEAAWHLRDSAELARRIGLSQNKEIAITFTPDHLARHQE
jgi:hypothetical protein